MTFDPQDVVFGHALTDAQRIVAVLISGGFVFGGWWLAIEVWFRVVKRMLR